MFPKNFLSFHASFEVIHHLSSNTPDSRKINIVVLWNPDYVEDVTDDIKSIVTDDVVVSYPSPNSKEDGVSNVKDFVEKNNRQRNKHQTFLIYPNYAYSISVI